MHYEKDKFIDDEGQVTPHADALAESENALATSGTAGSRDERGFTRDKTDMDVSTDEMLRFLVGMRAASAVSLGEVLDHVKATAAINAENTADARRSAAQGSDAILRSDSVFQSGLLKAFSLETDNEVLSTAALAQLIDGLLDKRIEALAAAQG